MPDVPTFKEAGLPDVNLATWIFLMAPAATPDAVVAQLNGTINDILKTTDMRDKLLRQGFVQTGGTVEEMARAHEGRGRALGHGDPQRQHQAGSEGTPVSELVKYEKNGQIVTITLDNPPVNAVSTKVLNALNAAFDRAEKEDDARVIIFAGEGQKAFCAGGDMREEKDFGDPETARAFRTFGRKTLNRIENGKLPVIAAIHGYCIGGGTALGWVCDIRVAAENSVFRAGDAYLGVLPSWGMGLTRLPRYVGRNKALDILLHRRELRRQGSLRDGPRHQGGAARQADGRVHRDRAAHLQGLAHRHPRHPPGHRRQPAPQLGRHGEAGARALRNDVRAPRCARRARRVRGEAGTEVRERVS